MDPSQLQRGLKLILKVGPNNTPEYCSSGVVTGSGPPTAAEAMCGSPLMLDTNETKQDQNGHLDDYRCEKHKKSKKKKKKKEKDRDRDRDRKHKHHKEKKRDKNGESHPQQETTSGYIECSDEFTLIASQDSQSLPITLSPKNGLMDAASSNLMPPSAEVEESSQDGFSFMDEESSQALGENLLFYAGMTTDNSPSCRPVSKPILPRKCDDLSNGSPASSSLGINIVSRNASAGGEVSPSKPLSDVSFSSFN